MNKEIELLINDYPIRVTLAQGRTKPKVACLGPEGTYTEAARYTLLGLYLDEMDAEFLDYNNTVVREINILGEKILGIQHMLIGWEGEVIDEIHSHPQALAQCRGFLLTDYPNAKQQPSSSTSAAIELVKKNRRIAAIASRRAAQINNMRILKEDIGDIKGNSTRFLMLGKGETDPTGQDSTSLIFVPKEDLPGILARCLTTLAAYGINLTKLDSRPTGIIRQYAFWATMDGHYKDSIVQRGIEDLKKTYCSSLRVLGSYRKAEIPAGLHDPRTINGG